MFSNINSDFHQMKLVYLCVWTGESTCIFQKPYTWGSLKPRSWSQCSCWTGKSLSGWCDSHVPMYSWQSYWCKPLLDSLCTTCTVKQTGEKKKIDFSLLNVLLIRYSKIKYVTWGGLENVLGCRARHSLQVLSLRHWSGWRGVGEQVECPNRQPILGTINVSDKLH